MKIAKNKPYILCRTGEGAFPDKYLNDGGLFIMIGCYRERNGGWRNIFSPLCTGFIFRGKAI